MGHVDMLGTFAPLFVNGVVKGLFNPVEKLDENFLNQVLPLPLPLPFRTHTLSFTPTLAHTFT